MESSDYLAKTFRTFQDYSSLEIFVLIAGLAIILAWLVLLTLFVYKLARKFTYDYQKNPYKEETLGMPRGTFRGLLTMTLLVVLIVMVCMSLLIDQFQGNFESLVGAFEVMIAFYFGSKIMTQVSEHDKNKAETKAKAEAEAAIFEGKGKKVDSGFNIPGSMG